MKSFRLASYSYFLILFIFISNPIHAQVINDLIQPVHLTSGEPDSILVSDLFYAKNHNVSFYPNKKY